MHTPPTKTLHAVLVGVNDYGGNNLGGCINDVHLLSTYLEAYCSQAGLAWKPRYFLSPRGQYELEIFGDDFSCEAATRKNMIKQAFPHFKQAKAGDVCLFYFSGHGSTTPSPAAFAYQRANQRNQTIVLADSRREGGYDLVDKELGYLIYEALLDPNTKKQKEDVHFVAIMDCCYAGDSTRLFDETPESRERMHSQNPNIPVLANYYGREHYEVQIIDGEERLYVPTAKHVTLAASQHDQSSREASNPEGYNGVFTYHLVKSLLGGAHHYSYKQLLQRVRLLIPPNNPQYPDVDAVLDEDGKYQPFLGGKARMDTVDYFIKYDKERQRWYLDAGAMHGITASLAGNGSKTTLERADLPEGHPNRRIVVTKVFSQVAEIEGSFTEEDKQKAPIRVFLAEQALPQTTFAIAPDADEVLVQKLRESQGEFQQSLVYAAIVEENEKATFVIHTEPDGNYVVTRRDSQIPLFKRTNNVIELLDGLETVARWFAVKGLVNNNSKSQLSANTIKIRVQKIEGVYLEAENADDDHGSHQQDILPEIGPNDDVLTAVELNYQYDEEEATWVYPALRLAIELNTEVRRRDLYVSVLYMGSKFGIKNEFLPLEHLRADDINSARLKMQLSGAISSVYTIPIHLDRKYLDLGITEIKDYLKIFIAEQPLDTSNFNQSGLELPTRFLKSGEEYRNRFRHDQPRLSSKWKVITLPIVIRRPCESREVYADYDTDFGFLQLSSPISAVANFGVSNATSTQVTSSSKSEKQIKAEEQYLAGNTQYLFAGDLEQAANVPIDVLELTKVSLVEISKLQENPLQVKPQNSIQAGEAILPYTYDEELDLIIPLGFTVEDQANSHLAPRIEVKALPKPQKGTRFIEERDKGLLDSYQVYFRKFVTSRYAKQFDYPLLQSVTANGVQDVDTKELKAIARKAQKPIAVFVHGLYGDNEYVIRNLRLWQHDGRSILTNYDLVLTFNYENLGTEIGTSAKELKKKLAEFLPEEGGPPVHLIGYAMGGLVCRYYLEHLDGDKQVSDLIMLGTPNKGTIWADIQAYLLTTITGAINTGTAITNPWVVPITAYLGRFVDKSFTTFQQMQPHSALLSELSAKPKENLDTKYHLIAGNTHLAKTDKPQGQNLMQRIVNGLRSKFVFGTVDITLFDSTSNDAFATVDSMKDCPYLEKENIYEVPCDLFSYYSNTESRATLVRILMEKVQSK